MDNQSAIDELRNMLKIQDRDTSHSILADLWDREMSFDDACDLLQMLKDDEEDYDIMMGIIHAIERADPKDVYKSISAQLVKVWKNAPTWAQFVVARHLAAESSQGNGFDAMDFLDAMASNNDQDFSCVLRLILEKVNSKYAVDFSNIKHDLIDKI